MKNELTFFDSLLYKDFRPWLPSSSPDEKFAPLISDIKIAYPANPYAYEIEFYRPANNKTKYYQKLIQYETILYCNNVIALINSDKNTKITKYWINDTLNKKLKSLLIATSKIIKDNNYDINYIDPHKSPLSFDAEHKSCAYIMHYTRLSLMKIYLEIQKAFIQFVPDALTPADFYQTFFSEAIPTNTFIKELTIIKVDPINEMPAQAETPTDIDFKPNLNDFRPEKKGVCEYKDMIKNQQRFASFEENLFRNSYIYKDYSFTDQHGYKNELAIIYHHLISKGYFKGFNDSTKKEISLLDIVKFLNHRYNTDVNKQFRIFTQKREEISKFVENNSWLYNLPSCS